MGACIQTPREPRILLSVASAGLISVPGAFSMLPSSDQFASIHTYDSPELVFISKTCLHYAPMSADWRICHYFRQFDGFHRLG